MPYLQLEKAVSGFVEINGRRGGRARSALAGDLARFNVKPDRYQVKIDLAEGQVRDNGREVILFDDAVLKFEMETAPATATPSADGTMSHIVLPRGVSLEIRELNTGHSEFFDLGTTGLIPKGRYAATLRDRSDRVVKNEVLVVDSTETVHVADWSSNAAQVAIAARLPNLNGAIDFSESLQGPVSDPDLGVWLALLGAGRIMSGINGGDYSKIGGFPLHDFANERPGSSPLYVLVGLGTPEYKVVHVGVSDMEGLTEWHLAVQPDGLQAVHEFYASRARGPQLVSFRVGTSLPYTVASLASPNRATLITLTLDEEGSLIIAQYLLPLGRLTQHLDPLVSSRLAGRNHLADVKMLAQSIRAFRSRRDISKTLPTDMLNDILYAKWVDPIASTLSAYELIRRGQTEMLPQVVQNLTIYFPDFPDAMALAQLSGRQDGRYRPVPLFLDGLRAFGDIEGRLPLPAAQLDYTSPWTAWRGAR